jgi:hypothetical protein
MAAGRLATIFSIVALVQAPRIAYALLLPNLAFQVTFGALSGYVSYHLVRAAGGMGQRPDDDPKEHETKEAA